MSCTGWGSNDNRFKIWEGGGGGLSDWFSILVFIRGDSLQYTSFLSLSDVWSLIVSVVIPVYPSGNQENIKAAPFCNTSQNFLTHCVFVEAWIGWKIAAGEINFSENCKSNCVNK